MKKRIIAAALAVCMMTTLAIGMTLAYFTDTKTADNVFTIGNVAIKLDETFIQDSKLVPGSNKMNNIKKEVFVENTGSEAAYVRVHIAIPSILDDGLNTWDAAKNMLHFNNRNMETGKWNWSTSLDRPDGAYTKNNNWNYYETTIDDISYNVYVVTYETALEKGITTPTAMDQVYLDSKATNADIAKIKETLGDKWQIKVAAEAVQASGFTNAYAAFAETFKTTATDNNPWTVVAP